MLCRAFTFLAVLLLALQEVFPFHRRERAFYCFDQFLVAECSDIILEGEFRIIYEDYRQEDAEKSQLTEGHLLG